MEPLSRIVVIYNPNSTGAGKEKAEHLRAQLQSAGVSVPVDLIATEYAGHATELAFEVATKFSRPLIVSSSGDGGYNEVVNGALRAQTSGASPVCAVLPAGNANDHRRTTARHRIVDAIVEQQVAHIDVLKATIDDGEGTERYAHSYIGLGLTPAIAVELNRTSLNRIKESMIVMRAFRKFHPVEIDVDGKRLVVDSVVFANISQMAKVLTVARNARPDDGTFKVVTLPYRHKLKLLTALARAVVVGLRGKSATSYTFRPVKDMALQFDGEVLDVRAGEEVRVSIEPQLLATIR